MARDSLFAEYVAMQRLWQQKLGEVSIDLFAERNRELDVAFPEDEPSETRLRQSLVNNLTAEFSLVPLVRADKDFVLFAGGRLAKFQHWNNTGALGFKGSAGYKQYDLVYRRENGKWILTR